MFLTSPIGCDPDATAAHGLELGCDGMQPNKEAQGQQSPKKTIQQEQIPSHTLELLINVIEHLVNVPVAGSGKELVEVMRVHHTVTLTQSRLHNQHCILKLRGGQAWS